MKPTLQQKLNMANKTVAELMEQNAKLIQSNDLHVNENIQLTEQNAQLKDDLVNANIDIEKLIKSVNEVTAAQQQPIIYNNCTFYK